MNKDEIIKCVSPSDEIKCKDCKFRIGNTVFLNDYHKICCEKYEYPDEKPAGILLDNEDCKYYEKGII